MSRERIWEMWRVGDEFHYLLAVNFGIWNDTTNQKMTRGIFLEEINRCDHSPMRLWHVAWHLTINVKVHPKNSCKFYSVLGDPWTRGQLMVNWKFNSHSSVRVVRAKKARMAVPSKMVIQEHMARPRGKCLDDPQHLENSIEIYLQKPVRLNHMLLFQGMSKILVHRYNFLFNT